MNAIIIYPVCRATLNNYLHKVEANLNVAASQINGHENQKGEIETGEDIQQIQRE